MFIMSYMFDGCSLLISLPDILKWNTRKIIIMSYLLNDCHNLLNSNH